MERPKKIIFLLLLMFFVSALTSVASAATVAYWRFEPDDPDLDFVGTPGDGDIMPHTDSGTVWRKAAHDYSGNGNHLGTYAGYNGLRWESDVPVAVIPLTGEDNALCTADLTAGNPDGSTFSELSNPSGTDIGDKGYWTPEQWTIEASFYTGLIGDPTSGGYRTIVGRDGEYLSWNPALDHENNVGAFYLTVRPANQLATEFTDMNGVNHVIESDDAIITEGRWYHTVVVSDGETYSLYLEDVELDTGYQLVGQLDMTGSSIDTRLAHGDSNGTTWKAGNFTVGRAVYNGGKVDTFDDGYIDEIRISDTALRPSQFLFQENATEPFPADESAYGPTDVNLSWTPAGTTAEHDVYFGTDVNAVNDATHDSNEYMDTIDTNSYWVYDVNRGTTYYWRIDAIEEGGSPKHTGQVWSFLSMWLKAWELYPYDGKTHVLLNAELSWNAGANSTASKVYIGETPDNLTLRQTIAHTEEPRYSYSLSGISPDYETDYYWRIDQESAEGDVEGDVYHLKTIPDIDLVPNLVGWWKFDEGKDNAIDWSGNGQHGTIYGGAQPAAGYEGEAILLDGDDDYVSLPIGTTISGLRSSTFCAWVNFVDAEEYWWQRIFDFGDSTVVNMFLTPRGGPPALRFAITTGGSAEESQIDSTAGVLPTGWHHVAVVIDEAYSMVRLYLDLAPVGSGSTLLYPENLGETTNNWLGRSQYPADAYFDGRIDDFRIYNYALTQDDLRRELAPREASLPDPPHLGTRVDRNPVLSWLPGRYAADSNGHELYYSLNFDDVNDPCNRVGDPCVLDDPCFVIPAPNAPYDSLDDVYWVVDEVNDDHPDKKWPGNVWQFTIRDYSFIDEFELYSDTGKVFKGDPEQPQEPAPGTLKSVWIDGNYAFEPYVTDGTSGSIIQLNTDTNDCHPLSNYYPDCPHYTSDDNDIYLSEEHSMKFYYDNDGTVNWEDELYGKFEAEYVYTPTNPYISEIYAAIDDDAQEDENFDSLDILRDWSGYKVLDIPFYGDPGNDAEPMYVSLEDSNSHVATVSSNQDLTKPWWQDWYIAMSEFTTANGDLELEYIVKIYIGFGNKSEPSAGGSGVVFFDDIQLLEEGVCMEEFNGDISDDCVVNEIDLQLLVMAEPWHGVKPASDPLAGYTPIIKLEATAIQQALDTPVASWDNTGSMLGSFDVNDNISDGNRPVLEMVEGKKAVTFADINDLLIWTDKYMPGSVTGANDFTVVIEAFNINIGVEEWILAWAERSTPDGSFAAFGYGTHEGWGAAAHYGDPGPDMGFGPLVAPPAHTWHTIIYTYDGNDSNSATVDSYAEHVIVDGLVYNSEPNKVLLVEPNQPVVLGTAYGPPSGPGEGILGGTEGATFDPVWANPDLRFTGSVASIKVYDESISAVEKALWEDTPADLYSDDRIDFKDVAYLGNQWLKTGKLFGD